MNTTAPIGRLLSITDVKRETSFSRTTIWRRIKEGTFPKPLKLGVQKRAWRESDVEKWKAEQPLCGD